jgi:hypothetical protein
VPEGAHFSKEETMKIKTNVRAGQGGADDTTPDTSTSSSNQKQKGKSSGGGATVPVSRCVGI